LLVRLPLALDPNYDEEEHRLQAATEIIREIVRSGDLLGRHGRSSICVFLYGVTPEDAEKVALRVRVWLKDYEATIGVASFPEQGTELMELIGAARLTAF
jgi:GGDEF domain-containing protein